MVESFGLKMREHHKRNVISEMCISLSQRLKERIKVQQRRKRREYKPGEGEELMQSRKLFIMNSSVGWWVSIRLKSRLWKMHALKSEQEYMWILVKYELVTAFCLLLISNHRKPKYFRHQKYPSIIFCPLFLSRIILYAVFAETWFINWMLRATERRTDMKARPERNMQLAES